MFIDQWNEIETRRDISRVLGMNQPYRYDEYYKEYPSINKQVNFK